MTPQEWLTAHCLKDKVISKKIATAPDIRVSDAMQAYADHLNIKTTKKNERDH